MNDQGFGYSQRSSGYRKRSLSREREDGGYGAKRSRGGYDYQDGGRRRNSSGYRGRDDGYDNRSGRRPTDPYDLDYLVSSSQFADYLRRGNRSRTESMTDDELDRRYEVYRDNFTRKQNERFFQKHKDDEWFLEKYHPEGSKALLTQSHERRRIFLEKYLVDLGNGLFDQVTFDQAIEEKPSVEEEKTEGKEGVSKATPETSELTEQQDKADDKGEAMALDEASDQGTPTEITDDWAKDLSSYMSPSLVIKSIPDTAKRAELLELFREQEGFETLVLSDPRLDKKMYRLGWILFKEGTDLDKVLTDMGEIKLGEFVLHLAINRSSSMRKRTLPLEFSEPERLQHDLGQIKKLAETLDAECQFPEESGCKALVARLGSGDETMNDDDKVDVPSSKKLLDLYIHYLLKVHQYDYYGGVEAVSTEEFMHKLTLHFRRVPTESQFKSQPGELPKRVDVRTELRMNRPLEGTDPSFMKLGGKSLERVVDTFLSDYVKKETDAKHRCTVCQKLFKGDEFVKKHLKTKHPETSSEITSETLLFNAYMLDSNRVDPLKAGPSPQQQQQSSIQGRQFAQPRSRGPYNRNQDSRPPPPGHARSDPRQIRSYQDLDAPVEGEIQLSYD